MRFEQFRSNLVTNVRRISASSSVCGAHGGSGANQKLPAAQEMSEILPGDRQTPAELRIRHESIPQTFPDCVRVKWE